MWNTAVQFRYTQICQQGTSYPVTEFCFQGLLLLLRPPSATIYNPPVLPIGNNRIDQSSRLIFRTIVVHNNHQRKTEHKVRGLSQSEL